MTKEAWQIAEDNAPVHMERGIVPFRTKRLRGISGSVLEHYKFDPVTEEYVLGSLPESETASINAHAEHGLPVVPDGFTLASWTAKQEQEQAAMTDATWAEVQRLEAVDSATNEAQRKAFIARETVRITAESERFAASYGRPGAGR